MQPILRCRCHQVARVCGLIAAVFGVESVALGQRGPAVVTVSAVVERPVAEGQTFVGTVTPVRRSVVGSAVDGRVAEFPINQGDLVHKGQPLAQLLTETIGLELSAARSELKLREEELQELKNGSRPEELRRVKAAMLAAEAVADYQRKRLTRAKELFERTAINDDEMQLVVSEATRAEQEYQQALEVHALAVAGPRPEQIAQAQARVAMQQAITEKLSDQLGKHTIKAPFNGYVVAEFTEVGQWLARGEHVAEVIAVDEVDIVAQVLENQAPYVRPGQHVRVEVPALPGRILTGAVFAIVPQADLRSRTFPVLVRVKNSLTDSGPLLKSGMLARVTLPTGPPTDALLVPKDALVLGGLQSSVYVVLAGAGEKPATVRPVPVILGVANGGLIQVTGDVKPGDQVVVRGNERLRPGQEVKVTQVISVDESQSVEGTPAAAKTDAGTRGEASSESGK
ncbi:efflux RND transporter periplasmic adaptor subunit [bacterium]|nr:efflux RND transporter periplasmic adaptor subunit [bacterium]